MSDIPEIPPNPDFTRFVEFKIEKISQQPNGDHILNQSADLGWRLITTWKAQQGGDMTGLPPYEEVHALLGRGKYP